MIFEAGATMLKSIIFGIYVHFLEDLPIHTDSWLLLTVQTVARLFC